MHTVCMHNIEHLPVTMQARGVLPFIALCRPIALYFFGDFSSLFCHFIWPFVCLLLLLLPLSTVGDLLLLWLPIDHVVVVVVVAALVVGFVGQLLGAFAGRFVATFWTLFLHSANTP